MPAIDNQNQPAFSVAFETSTSGIFRHWDDSDIFVLGADIMLGIRGWLLARLLLGTVRA